jgi:hypothetical protein
MRQDTGASYEEFLPSLGDASGIENSHPDFLRNKATKSFVMNNDAAQASPNVAAGQSPSVRKSQAGLLEKDAYPLRKGARI